DVVVAARKPLEFVDPLQHPPRLVEPAQPVPLVGAGPDRGVASPDAVDELDRLERAHSRNSSTSRSNSSGFSMLGTCAVPGIDARRAFGISASSRSAMSCISG